MQQFFINLILELVKALGGVFTPKSEDGASKGDLEVKLKDQIKKDGWKV
jgi:hypothetical protein